MAESEEKIKKKRSVIRTLTTKLITNIDASLSDDIEFNLAEIEELRDQLIGKETELKQLDSQIEIFTDIDELENEITLSQEYRDRIIVYKSRIHRKITEMTKTKTDSIHSSNSSVRVVDREVVENSNMNDSSNNDNVDNRNNGNYVDNHSNVNNVNSFNAVKLPKLTINKFFGDPSKWLELWHQFESAVENNTSLSEVDKFNYLKSFLGGTALTAVSGFALTNDNYQSALKVLKLR